LTPVPVSVARRDLAEFSQDAIVVIDRAGVIRRRPLGQDLFGYTADELYLTNALDLVHPDDLAVAARELLAAVEDPEYRRTIELRIRHADGHWITVELIAASRLEDPSIDGIVMNVRDVSGRPEATAALRASEERYRSLLSDLPAVVFRWDPAGAGTTAFASAYVEQVTGYSPDLFMSGAIDLQAIVTAPHAETVRRARADAIRDRRAYVVEYEIEHRDGDTRWVAEHGHAMSEAGGPHRHLEGVIFDITDRVRAIAEIDHSREWLDTVITNVPGAVFRCEIAPPYRDLFTSDRIAELVGWTQTDLKAEGRTLYDLIPDPQLTEIGALVDDAIAHHRAYVIEYQMRHRDGSLRWIEERGQAKYGPSGPEWLDGILFDVTDRKELEARLAEEATHDALTGLPNRRALLEHLDRALVAGGARTGLLFVDLDRFKLVNDALGHASGDELLTLFGHRLRGVLRADDFAARTGGDEFVVVCAVDERSSATMQLAAVADRITLALKEPFRLHGRETFITASVGIAEPTDDATPASLLRDADIAVYHAKDNGRDRAEVFDERLRGATSAALALETELHHALSDDQLEVHLQPIVELATGRRTGAEALLRWAHPRLGLIGPDRFLDRAHATGLIVPIGHRVIERTVAALSGTSFEALPYATINLSPRELAEPRLADHFVAALETHGVEPSRVRVELTEQSLLTDTAVAVLHELHAHRIRLVLDDFGTGYSPLNYLLELPITGVKIDRGFVTGVTPGSPQAAVIAGIVGLARALGLEVVAEGVEATDEAALLVELGVTHAQGFHFSRPVPLDTYLAPLAAGRPDDPR
jgi:diguanylate cyclase (GGDEF)-like protein/PAS domain S-box-containing protein